MHLETFENMSQIFLSYSPEMMILPIDMFLNVSFEEMHQSLLVPFHNIVINMSQQVLKMAVTFH
jgi:hypothetical protein